MEKTNSSATTAAAAAAVETLPEWQKESTRMARLVQEHVLDPLMTLVELVEESKDVEAAEANSVLRLLVLGAYMEVQTYCVPIAGDHLSYVCRSIHEAVSKEWQEAIQVLDGVAAGARPTSTAK